MSDRKNNDLVGCKQLVLQGTSLVQNPAEELLGKMKVKTRYHRQHKSLWVSPTMKIKEILNWGDEEPKKEPV